MSEVLKNIKNVSNKMYTMGESLFEDWEKTNDLNKAKYCIDAFKTSLKAESLIIQQKKVQNHLH